MIRNKNEFYHVTVCAIGTFIADAVSYPVELIATLIKSTNNRTPILKTTATFIKENGFRALYNGSSTLTFTTFFPNLVYFSVYEKLKHLSNSKFAKEHMTTVSFFSSMIAESCFIFCMVPFETIQTRMQMNTMQYNYRSLSHGLYEVVTNEGFFRLFSTSPLFLWQLLIFTPVQFSFYEYLTERQMKKTGHVTLAQSIQSTILASSFAGAITNPINTLIIRFQLENFSERKKSVFQMIRESVKTHGFLSLNKGLMIRLVERNLNSLCYLPLYEMAGQYFHTNSHE